MNFHYWYIWSLIAWLVHESIDILRFLVLPEQQSKDRYTKKKEKQQIIIFVEPEDIHHSTE